MDFGVKVFSHELCHDKTFTSSVICDVFKADRYDIVAMIGW